MCTTTGSSYCCAEQKFCGEISGNLPFDTFLLQMNDNHCLIHDNIVTFDFLLVTMYFDKHENLKLYNEMLQTHLL